MLFNSFEFLVFLAVVLTLYYLPGLRRLQPVLLIVSSLYFYTAAGWQWLPLLLLSIGATAVLSWQGGRRRPWMVVLGISLNLGMLALFKYGPLCAQTFWPEGHWLQRKLSAIPLPIGISFFTFEAVVILVDSLRHRERLAHTLGRVTLLMSFFPHLVSGPILRAGDFFPQVGPKSWRHIDWDKAFRNLVSGYFLKMVVADNLKEQTSMMPYCEGGSSGYLAALLFGYSMQIFADFAGYSLIAIGLAALFGYRLPDNFRFPYLADSFSDFWQRWHISLSSFLRDYLYIPLGGNRHGLLRTNLNLLIVMVLGGLWHGPAWRYAGWGLAHGLALVVERTAGRCFRLPRRGPVRVLRTLVVFTYVSLAWLLFQLPELSQVQAYLKALVMHTDRPLELRPVLAILCFSTPVLLYHLGHGWSGPRFQRLEPWIYAGMLFLILTNSGPPGVFIYFQF